MPHPTDPFTTLEPHDQEIGDFYVALARSGTGIEAPKLWKDRQGRFKSPARRPGFSARNNDSVSLVLTSSHSS